MNLLTDVMLFVGKLHSAHLFQIDSELVLSNATPSTQELRQSWIRLETGGGVKCVNIVKSNAITLPEEACQVVREKAKGKGVKVIIVVLRIIIHQLAGKDFCEVKMDTPRHPPRKTAFQVVWWIKRI